jgi:hypothetical protein
MCKSWMDWIWSFRCLALICTSTQSSNLKWVSGGGINSPRHPKSRWLTATEKGSIGWTDDMLFQGVGSSGALHVTQSLQICWYNCSNAIYRRCVRSSGAKWLLTKTLLSHLRDRWMNCCSAVSSSGAEAPVLACLCLDSNEASDRSMVSPLRSPVHPVLLTSLLHLCNSSGASRN